VRILQEIHTTTPLQCENAQWRLPLHSLGFDLLDMSI
jgi:hypothetical protein